MLFFGKKGQNRGLMFLGIALVVLYLVQSGSLKLPALQAQSPAAGGAASVQNLAGTNIPCPVEDTTLSIGPVQDKFDTTQVTNTLMHGVYVNGVDRGLVVDGGTIQTSPGDKIKVVYAALNSTFINDVAEFTIPCKGAIDTGAINGGAWKVTRFGNLTVRLFNPSNGNVNAGGDNESLAANQVKNFRLELEAGSKLGYVTKNPLKVVCEGSSAQFSNIAVKGAGWTAGGEVPGLYTVTNTANRAFVSVYDPAASGSQGSVEDSKIVNGVVTIEGGGTNPAPATGNRCIIYTKSWIKDPDTGVYRVDYQTQRNAADNYDEASFQYFVS